MKQTFETEWSMGGKITVNDVEIALVDYVVKHRSPIQGVLSVTETTPSSDPKVIDHGVTWYFEKSIPRCPECGAGGIANFKIMIFNRVPDAKKKAEVICKVCDCVFEPPKQVI